MGADHDKEVLKQLFENLLKVAYFACVHVHIVIYKYLLLLYRRDLCLHLRSCPPRSLKFFTSKPDVKSDIWLQKFHLTTIIVHSTVYTLLKKEPPNTMYHGNMIMFTLSNSVMCCVICCAPIAAM